MRAQINFKVINADYNQDYANEYHFGKESENNWKYTWATTYELSDINSVELLNPGTFVLKGKYVKGESFEIPIHDTVIFRLHQDIGSSIDFGVSKSILSKTHQASNEKYDITRCYFYIKAEPESVAITDNFIINVIDIPDELKK